MVNIFDLISQKIELFRLEQRYTKRRNRRSTFVSDAVYVDGEYIYSSSSSSSPSSPPPTLSKRPAAQQFPSSSQESVSTEESRSPRGARFEAPGGAADLDRSKPKRGWSSARALKRRSMVTVREMRWEGGGA